MLGDLVIQRKWKMPWKKKLVAITVMVALLLPSYGPVCQAQYVQNFSVYENLPAGQLVGVAGDIFPNINPPFMAPVVREEDLTLSVLSLERHSGRIVTRKSLDRETKDLYFMYVMPSSSPGDVGISVNIHVLDKNDNNPHFPNSTLYKQIPENAPTNSMEIPLGSVSDMDMGNNSVKVDSCRIASGNIGDAFRLETRQRTRHEVNLDLVINHSLDYEMVRSYSLVITATDGGSPPLTGQMRVDIDILDENDNYPIFNQSRYSARIPENVTVGTSVLRVYATDQDSGENGRVVYSIDPQSDVGGHFSIDAVSGVLRVNKPLDYETQQSFVLNVIGKNPGDANRDGTAAVEIYLDNINEQPANISLQFMQSWSDGGKVSENAPNGTSVARISISDPDSPRQFFVDVNVTLVGGEGVFGLRTSNDVVYLVVVSRPPDRETKPYYNMTLVATDSGNPPLHASRTFTIWVDDENDNDPVFTQDVYRGDIQEVAEPGTSVVQVSATDRDVGVNAAIRYSILDVPGTQFGWFQIDANTGLVTTLSGVDCEINPRPKLIVQARDGGNLPRSATSTVLIEVHDVNDNQPVFDQSFYSVEVAEDTRVGRCIVNVTANDPECGTSAPVTYQFAMGLDRPSVFEIHANSGQICIKQSLDFELQSQYNILVQANDRDGYHTTAQVRITLKDVNDNLPQFEPEDYRINVRESQAVGPLLSVKAHDADFGSFGTVSYSILSRSDQNFLELDAGTGEVSLSRQLPRGERMYSLQIQATDGGGRSALRPANVTVSVVGANIQPPVFSPTLYNFTISEGASVGSPVGQVVASTDDGSVVSYQIVSGSQGWFRIDASTGFVYTTQLLDREQHISILMSVVAQAGNPPTYSSAQVNVTLLDINDNSPVFNLHESSLTVNVKEDLDLGRPFVAVQASDPDNGINGSVRYRLRDNPGQRFHMDTVSGEVRLQVNLDYEDVNARHFELVIVAGDQGRPSRSTSMTLIVEVVDVNDNAPQFSQSRYIFNVNESIPLNAKFAQVSASDRDSGDRARVSFTLLDSPALSKFGIFPSNGFLYVRGPLDREEERRYDLTVVVTDHGRTVKKSSSAQIQINVVDVNDNDPVFTRRSYHFSIQENQPRNTLLGSVSATDADEGLNAQLEYSLETPQDQFAIEPSTGNLVTSQKLDREQSPEYTFRVRVSDKGSSPRVASVPVTISVLDMNDNAPMFEQTYQGSVKENKPKDTKVVRVRASDLDAGENGTVSYFFDAATSRSGIANFAIHPKTGEIVTREVLDFEAQSRYSLVVVARDSGSPPQESRQTVVVSVVDENDQAPLFRARNVTFPVVENTPVGTVVGQVLAQDSDSGENGRVSYYLVSGNVFSLFSVDHSTGKIYTIREIDYEESSSHVLGIKAIDNSAVLPRSSNISVIMQVIDVNDNTPSFERDPVILPKIKENLPLGSLIYTFSATDRDSGMNGTVRYFIHSESSSPRVNVRRLFSLDANTGQLRVAGVLDYEQVHQISLIVKAMDMCPRSSCVMSAMVTTVIFLVDENDNAPRFESRSEVHVFEDEPLDYPLLYIIAVDADANVSGSGNNVVQYHIASGNQDGIFQMDSVSGLLTLAAQLDREQRAIYELAIVAEDGGSPSKSSRQTLTVYVEDVNDSAPHFSNSTYYARVPEHASSPRMTVVTLTATDADIGANGNLSYLIPKGIAEDRFSVNPLTGVVQTTSTLDREEKAIYYVTAYVRDGGYPTQYDMTTIIVEVEDINDNSPIFKSQAYSLKIPENQPQNSIFAFVAHDLDVGRNAQIKYSISGGNDGRYQFNIDPDTGELSCGSLDREAVASYNLTITARDGGSPSREGHTLALVEVLDINDNDPAFTQAVYRASLAENVQKGHPVLQVSASDPDLDYNGHVTYSLGNDTEGFFSVNSSSGEIFTTGLFDREKKASYSFVIVAHDGGVTGMRNTSARVEITITDVNDNPPVFQMVPYQKTVGVGTTAGSTILTVRAVDLDYESNGRVRYSLLNHGQLFTIGVSSGTISTRQTLSSPAYYNVQVLARDQGNPSLSSTGVVEITVGSSPGTSLTFEQSEYQVSIDEHLSEGSRVTQVRATGSPGVVYAFANGVHSQTFTINPSTGIITVANSSLLDYEVSRSVKVIVAASLASQDTSAYATVQVNLTDINDNDPKFSQSKYISAVWENSAAGTFVTRVIARDADEGRNGYVSYNIIHGNIGDVFTIDPPYTGIIKTNEGVAPPDYEIKKFYKLTIEAMDHGDIPRSSTCMLRINVVDINDNQPYLPHPSSVNITENSEIGSHITTVTANDVDTDQTLYYDFDSGGNPEDTFSIDRLSGSISLAKALDYERRNHYSIGVKVFDGVHTDVTQVQVAVQDINDNAPLFSQQSYQVALPETTAANHLVIRVNATDLDSGNNAWITYRMGEDPVNGFRIDENTGAIMTNRSLSFLARESIVQLVVVALDHGNPALSSMVAIDIQITDINKHPPFFLHPDYTAHVSESSQRGDTVIRVSAEDLDLSHRNDSVNYHLSGIGANAFHIRSTTGEIFLNSRLNHEEVGLYNLTVMAKDRGFPPKNASVALTIIVDDENDNAPVFQQQSYGVTLNESYPAERVFQRVLATDADSGNNSAIQYTITSGNTEGLFHIHNTTGGLFIMTGMHLDYETHSWHRLIIRAVDCNGCPASVPKLSAFVTVDINVTDVPEFAPIFPVQEYVECVEENKNPGTEVFQAHANDQDGGIYGVVTYSFPDPSSFFQIHPDNGSITTLVRFDYETRSLYTFRIRARDTNGNATVVNVTVKIIDADEHTPVFNQTELKFEVPGNAKAGTFLGRVSASDEDGGTAGRVVYSFKYPQPHFRVDPGDGGIYVFRSFHEDAPASDVTRVRRALADSSVDLVILAWSGLEGSRTAEARVRVDIDRTCDGCAYVPAASTGLSPVATGMIILVVIIVIAVAFVLGVIFLLRRRRNKKPPPNMEQEPYDIHPHHHARETNGAPPAYKDYFSHNNLSVNVTSSDVSDHSHHSGSSGRGSAEDEEEDEEIRMINSNPGLSSSQGYNRRKVMPDSGIQQDDDNMSEPSVQNHQEYLARLGIDSARIGKPKAKQGVNHSVESMHQFSDEGGGEGLNLEGVDYGKLTDGETDEEVAMIDRNKNIGFPDPETQHAGSLSSVINSEEEYSGSYNWDYLLDWGPQYQPLAHVFSEIAKLKDESVQPKKTPVKTVPQRPMTQSYLPPVRTIHPPPIITNAPPEAVALASPGGSSQGGSARGSVGGSHGGGPMVGSRGGVPMGMGRVGGPGHPSRPSQMASGTRSGGGSGSGSQPTSARASTMNTSMPSLPRSPISYESSFTSPALTPSFTPSLSPLATRTPSISPVVSNHADSRHSSGHNTPGRVQGKQNGHLTLSASSESEQEFRI